MKKLSLFILFFFLLSLANAQDLSNQEQELYNLIMEYRAQKKLPPIPLSKSLTFVAQTHAKDLGDNRPDVKKCNMHSWSKKGNWTSCCYTSDHKKAECMWNKPSELTSYKGAGFEISFGNFMESTTPIEALNGWKSSSGHNSVIINKGGWKNFEWKAIGIGIYKGYALIWFGAEEDLK